MGSVRGEGLPVRGAVLLVALGLGLGVVGGCKKKDSTTTTTKPEPSKPKPKPDEAPKLTIRVIAEENGNAGRPFYVVVRTVVLDEFVKDQYQHVVALVTAPDETVLASFLVFPGRASTVVIDQPKGSVGVYGLFTEATGTSWKRLFDAPKVIEVVAGRNRWLEGK